MCDKMDKMAVIIGVFQSRVDQRNRGNQVGNTACKVCTPSVAELRCIVISVIDVVEVVDVVVVDMVIGVEMVVRDVVVEVVVRCEIADMGVVEVVVAIPGVDLVVVEKTLGS